MDRKRQLGIAFLSSEHKGHWKDISKYLTDFTKKGKELPEVNYQVHPSERWRGYHGHCIPDAQYVLKFTSGNHFSDDDLGIISFDILVDALRIKQIQSRPFSETHVFLSPLKWERMLVKMIEDWTFSQGVSKLFLSSAETTDYYNKTGYLRNSLSLEDHQRNLKIRYDVTADRLGFEYNDEHKLWVKQNPSLAA